MSRLGDMFVLGQQISIAAKEEASRYDLPQVDVDHLLLALLVSGGSAGELLRGQGLTLDAARRATEQVRAQHVARLGIVAPAVPPRPIRDPALGEIDWTRRALAVVGGNDDRGELGLLAGLLDEPSRLVVEVLAEAGVDLGEVRAGLTDRRGTSGPAPVAASDPDWRGVTRTGFAPAPIAEVWALVSDLARRPEWDDTVRTVHAVGPDVWETEVTTSRPDGRPARRRPGYTRARHRRIAYEPEDLVEWEITLPDLRKRWPSRHRLNIRLRPATGGTALELTLSWPRPAGRHRFRQGLLHPVARAIATVQLTGYAAAVSRRLR